MVRIPKRWSTHSFQRLNFAAPLHRQTAELGFQLSQANGLLEGSTSSHGIHRAEAQGADLPLHEDQEDHVSLPNCTAVTERHVGRSAWACATRDMVGLYLGTDKGVLFCSLPKNVWMETMASPKDCNGHPLPGHESPAKDLPRVGPAKKSDLYAQIDELTKSLQAQAQEQLRSSELLRQKDKDLKTLLAQYDLSCATSERVSTSLRNLEKAHTDLQAELTALKTVQKQAPADDSAWLRERERWEHRHAELQDKYDKLNTTALELHRRARAAEQALKTAGV